MKLLDPPFLRITEESNMEVVFPGIQTYHECDLTLSLPTSPPSLTTSVLRSLLVSCSCYFCHSYQNRGEASSYVAIYTIYTCVEVHASVGLLIFLLFFIFIFMFIIIIIILHLAVFYG